MSKIVKDSIVKLVSEEEYLPELEEEVKHYMRITPDLPVNDIEYKRLKIPTFNTTIEKRDWEREEIKRIKKGYNGLDGKMYLYFHYGKIKDISGIINPEFRVVDHEWFKLITQCQTDDKGYSIVCVKRRRVGASWKEAVDVLHDAMFNKHQTIGMNSKSIEDSIELFKKVKFLYNQFPSFLRAAVTGDTKMSLNFRYFIKDSLGNRIVKGNQSEIICKAPTSTAFEGMLLQKWVCDEAGKIDNLQQLWSFTEPCLMKETKRPGVAVLFGTSGEVSGAGKSLHYMWNKADAYKFRRFFFRGYNGMVVDAKGNDLKEEAIRWIVYERYKKRELDPKTYNDFVQQFPLTVEEAFSPALTGGLGNQVKVVKQKSSLLENPPKSVRGTFTMTGEDEVRFIPSKLGSCVIYEHPQPGKAYLSGCDPADHDDAFDDASDLSTYIMSERDGLEPSKIVFEYTDRPSKLNDYYHQVVCALIYYNKCKILIERNRYRMIDYFEQQGNKQFLHYTPQGVLRLYATRKPAQIGVTMGNDAKKYLEDLVAEYIEDYCEFIPSVQLLDECIEYGAVNTDRVMAFGIALMLLKEKTRTNSRRDMEQVKKLMLPRFEYRKINGRIRRVDIE
jgi:hypothetical protein